MAPQSLSNLPQQLTIAEMVHKAIAEQASSVGSAKDPIVLGDDDDGGRLLRMYTSLPIAGVRLTACSEADGSSDSPQR